MFSDPTPENLLIPFRPGLSGFNLDPFSNPTPRKEDVVSAFCLRQIGSLEDSTPGRHTVRVFPWSWSPGFPWILSRTPPPEKKKFPVHSSFVRSGHSSLSPGAVRILSRTPPPEKKKVSMHSSFVRSGHSSLRPSAMHSVSLFPVKRRYEPKATEILRRHDTAPLEKRLCSC